LQNRGNGISRVVGDAAEKFDVSSEIADLVADDFVEFDDVVVIESVVNFFTQHCIDAALKPMEAFETFFVRLQDPVFDG
jgi:hypothetical protein